MTTRANLNSYVRYDGRGRVVPGANVLARTKPKVGNWVEITAPQCCGNCAALVYETDFYLSDVQFNEETGEVTFTFVTALGVSIQGQFIGTYPECDGTVLTSVTIPAGTEYEWTVSFEEILYKACDIRFRRVCSSGYSEWIDDFFTNEPT